MGELIRKCLIIFLLTQKGVDYLGRNAGHQQGAASMLIGDAANKSFQDGREHSIEDICPELGTSVRLSELV
ncbi:MAG: hypothetical protein CM1200mP3_17390 [Chloroflexota bacterium]|nr:MAG: hypothetical protein CM1200mP3_17390 [Chloroflexota bacterium]